MTLKFDEWPRKLIGHLFYILRQAFASFEIHRFIQTGVTVRKRSIRVKISVFFSFDLEIWWMTLKNNRAPLLYYVNLCQQFQSHQWIQTCVTVRKRLILVKIGNLLSRVTLKFAWWSWKTIVQLFYTTSSFVHHFKAINAFKLALQSGNAQFGLKLAIFGHNDFEIWRMTLKNYRALLLSCFKLCVSFRNHWWIETGVTIQKRQIWVKIDDFFSRVTLKFDGFSRVTLKFDGWPWKTIWHIS